LRRKQHTAGATGLIDKGKADMPALDVNGMTLAYDTRGDPSQPAVLLIMGLGMQMTAWPESFCDMLANCGFHVIRFDNRDSGLSSKLDQHGTPNVPLAWLKYQLRLPLRSAYTLDDMAGDAVGLLDSLGISAAHIVGASMGGMIAQIIAARYPQRTLTLTSIMSTSGRRSLPGPTSKARRALFSRPRNPRDPESVIRHLVQVFRVIGSPGYPTPEAELRAGIAASLQRANCPRGTARQLVAVAASGSRERLLKTVRVPSQVIHGTADPLVPLASGRDTARLIPGAVLHEIPGMGHDLPAALHGKLVDLIHRHAAQPAHAVSQASRT
jgi:pimeloyl-ACP methyl ester carboxylesterase